MNKEISEYPILVHSHLPWSGVWQRPQQFHSRLSQRHPILFVEGPVPVDSRKQSVIRTSSAPGYPQVTILQMEVPGNRWGNGAFIDAERRRLIDEYLASPAGSPFNRPVQWFYDPMAVTAFSEGMNERAIVYDCMDQLSQFKFAPPEIITREMRLLEIADVVFAGGPKLKSSKELHHDNVFCFGCGVDADHFGKALQEETAIPEDVRDLPGPVLGFFGVVDERMDYELIAALADADPDWQIVIIGPPAKVNPDDFPKRQNVHWLGRREYPELPAYCKKFDVCLLPFAINEATEFINPTKALEYMATGRPIVSTPIEDVVLQFSDIVQTAGTHRDFIEACRRAARQPDQKAISRGLHRSRNTTWDAIVAQMEGHIEDIFINKRTEEVTAA